MPVLTTNQRKSKLINYAEAKNWKLGIPDYFKTKRKQRIKILKTSANTIGSINIDPISNCCGGKLLHSLTFCVWTKKEQEELLYCLINAALLSLTDSNSGQRNSVIMYLASSKQQDIIKSLKKNKFKEVYENYNSKSGNSISLFVYTGK